MTVATARRRVVSVLFVDLVGFTGLAESLDAEDVATVQAAYFDLARTVVEAHHGTVEKYVGDAVLGSFGTSEADDEDAQHAVRAGWEVLAGLPDLAMRLGLAPDVLRGRAAVNTGEVLVTPTEDGWRLAGDVVNVAARLQAGAQPGQVVVADTTAFVVAPHVTLEPLGSTVVRGRAAAVEAWAARAPADPARPGATDPLRRPRLVGRDHELDGLWAARTQAATRRHAVVVVAPPGVGKTRLVEAFVTGLGARGTRACTARVEPGDAGSYAPLAALLRTGLATRAPAGLAPVDGVAVLRRWAAVVDHDVPDAFLDHAVALLGGDVPDATRDELAAAWTTVVDRVVEDTPVWVVEDLHHAGDDLLAVLEHALHHGRSDRLVVATTRPEGELVRTRLGTFDRVVHLGPLGPDDVARQVGDLVGADVLPTDLLERVVATSGGNPLYVHELVRAWVHAGLLVREHDTWRLAASADPDIPATVQTLYLRQLDRLPGDARDVVDAGAVPGTTFPSGALPTLGVGDAEDSLALLSRTGLLRGPHDHELDPRSWSYHHALLRDTAYAALPRGERSRLHLAYARWLQVDAGPVPGGDTGPGAGVAAGEGPGVAAFDAGRAALVGGHLAEAVRLWPVLGTDGGDRAAVAEEAGAWLEASARDHLDSAPARAAGALEQALALPLPDDTPDHRRRALLAAEADRRRGRLEDAMARFATTVLAAADAGEVEVAVAAATGHEDALAASRLPRDRVEPSSMALLDRALAVVTADDARARARVLAARGQARLFAGDGPGGRADCAAAVALAEDGGDPAATARAVLARRAALARPGDLAARLDDSRVLVAAARRGGDAEVEFEGLRLRWVDLLEAGDVAAAERARRDAERVLAGLRRPGLDWYPAMWDGLSAHLRGDLAAAVDALERLDRLGRAGHYGDLARVVAAVRMSLCHDRADPAGAVAAIAPHHVEDPARWSGCMAASLALAGAATAAARVLHDVAPDDFAALPRDMSLPYTLSLLTLAASRAGVVDVAGPLARLLRPWSGHVVVLGSGAVCLGAADHYLGLAWRARGAHDRAQRALRRAVALNDDVGAVTAGGWSRLELADDPGLATDERRRLLGEVDDLVATHDLPGIRQRLAVVRDRSVPR